MSPYYSDEDEDELILFNEYQDSIEILEEEIDEDPFTEKLEDYGLNWRDF